MSAVCFEAAYGTVVTKQLLIIPESVLLVKGLKYQEQRFFVQVIFLDILQNNVMYFIFLKINKQNTECFKLKNVLNNICY